MHFCDSAIARVKSGRLICTKVVSLPVCGIGGDDDDKKKIKPIIFPVLLQQCHHYNDEKNQIIIYHIQHMNHIAGSITTMLPVRRLFGIDHKVKI